jgi:exosortase C (VPDSG-CTERM-specific)
VSNQPQIEFKREAVSSIAPKQELLASQVKTLAVLSVMLAICFAKPLYELVRFAAKSELFSHILLIPFISAYLVWIAKETLPPPASPRRLGGVLFFALGAAVLCAYWFGPHVGLAVKRDHLTWTTSALVLFFVGLCFFCMGPATLRAAAFPLALLIFAIPFPLALVDWTEKLLQHSSAEAADWFFTLTGTSFLRETLVFHLSTITLQVAPECSGIHSTLVLLITSLVAGQLFLTTNWKRAVLVLAVIPLGILRNGFRIWTLGQLCIHIGPQMIDSPIHHRGGPIFFVLSLIPFGALLYFLWRSDRRKQRALNRAVETSQGPPRGASSGV